MGKIASMKTYTLTVFTFILSFGYSNCDITVSTHDLEILLKEKKSFQILVNEINTTNATIQLIVQHTDIVKLSKYFIQLNNSVKKVDVDVIGLDAGHSEVYSNITVPNINVDDVFLRVLVLKNKALETVSIVIGWIYFVAWSVSFYPQIYINYKRKSVVGLNFDFLTLNIIGFTLYSTFNIGLYSLKGIQAEYFKRYPRGLNPVQINDIFFSVHAAIACLITIIQCYLYEREDQRVSWVARGLIATFGTSLFVVAILSGVNVIHWLDFLYFCSYVKLAITLIKYVPQAYMNYKRKSTVGWSIENIFLDFTGGILSMLQMILNAHNFNDWASIFGDPTKFGLGLFSVVFDIFFIVQHYVLYRHTNYEENTL